MPSHDAEVRRTSSKVGVGIRLGRLTDDDQRALATARLAVYIREIIEKAPPLSPAQKARLRGLLDDAGPGEQHGAGPDDLGGAA